MDPPVGVAPTWTCLQDRCLSDSATGEWRSREDLHLEPPASQAGMQNSYTSGAEKLLRGTLDQGCDGAAAHRTSHIAHRES